MARDGDPPLRAARRGIKTLAEAADDDVAALRKDVAALELRAEQIEQAMLYRMAPTLGSDTGRRRRRGHPPQRFGFGSQQARPRSSAPRLIDAALTHASDGVA